MQSLRVNYHGKWDILEIKYVSERELSFFHVSIVSIKFEMIKSIAKILHMVAYG